ncbi:FAD-dependent tricarballylate dehydrogenase TcuA [Leucobacter celer]|uniref:FAD-dependent tricarballylate dehydrogenase TcuA n=1 Tax=Leucobacter celer TaxID=668625 RepID=UPI0006A779A1|nr:FAD-dependent tricarballylate dehydrogenase TcuA [Leucobacter celer]
MTEGALDFDVIVVGGGNAGYAAALAAATRGRRTVLLERGERGMQGGNSFYTAGASRIVHNGLTDLQDFIEQDERHERTEVPPYTAEDYLGDLDKVTSGRNDKAMSEVLVAESQTTMRWLNGLGCRYRLMYERQAYERPDGGYLFWGGLHVGNVGGGEGMIADYERIAEANGVEQRWGIEVTGFVAENGTVRGVTARNASGEQWELRAESVILAAGGFEANPEMREEYLGEGWQNAKVRGTPYNTGELLRAALALGAARGGDWNSCHSVQWDAFMPENESNRELTNRLTRQSYPLGVIVNRNGERFLDEGEDFRNYTYAKYGKVILQQPGSVAWQVFDAALRPMLRTEEYDMPGISVDVAGTLEELAEKMGVPAEAFVETIRAYNESIDTTGGWDPTVKDGRAADTNPPKSNWARPLVESPFYAFGVTCGITFTFGGLKGDLDGRVLSESGEVIPGLFAVGEALGGLFSGNYPGGSGLVAGYVFGRRAGKIA